MAPSLPPAVAPTQIHFTGAVNGFSTPPSESCDYSATGPFGHFIVMAEGRVAERPYFISVSITPYRGPGSYELGPLPPLDFNDAFTPDPLNNQAPTGYPGFLNFLPKGVGHSYSADRTGKLSAMTVAPDRRSGWFATTMTAGDSQGGAILILNIAGRFRCGPAFEP